MNQIKFFRERAGMTQKQVALALRISIQSVSYWEAGDRVPSLENALALADLFCCSLDKMLGRNTEDSQFEMSLDRDEQELLGSYRRLNPEDQAHVRREIQILSSASKKVNPVSDLEDQKVG